MKMEGIKGFELEVPVPLPEEFSTAMKSLDSQQLKRSVELMGQCVQVHAFYSWNSFEYRSIK